MAAYEEFPGLSCGDPGSQCAGGKISETAILQAASLAAWYSSARSAANVEVDYTEVKHVKKPAGAKPGMVNYFNYRTVRVKPLPSCE